jgi:ligand-binding sensor domain-containing protein
VREIVSYRRTKMGVLILQLCFVWQSRALDPQASSYLRTDFTVEQGLPDDEVNAITQTPNGFLWVGTDGGLARFDGKHFAQIQLTAASPIRARSPEAVPIRNALMKINIETPRKLVRALLGRFDGLCLRYPFAVCGVPRTDL